MNTWVGHSAGVRKPEPGETPLSHAEVKVLLGRLRFADIEENEEYELLPIRRSIISFGMWELDKTNQEKAHPFQWLLK